jgi:UPF0755 protein
MADDERPTTADPAEPLTTDAGGTPSPGPAAPGEARPPRPAGSEGPARRAERRRSGRGAHSASRRPVADRDAASRPDRTARPPRPPRSPRPASTGVPRLPDSARARTRRLAVALGGLALIVGVLGFTAWSALYRAETNVPPGRGVTVVVANGSSSATVAEQLAKAGVIDNATMFRIQAQLMGATSDMMAGTYTFTTGSGYDAVIRQLQAGPPPIPTVVLAIPEGWGIEKIAARVEEKLGISAAEFVTLATTGARQFDYAFLAGNPTESLEGYLFPKTYTVKVGATAADVIRTMLAQYGKETAGLDYSYAESKGLTPHQALTVASIIEREASVPSDRPKVASVIYNRLAIGMMLQLDSTVQFALHGKATLTLADLQTRSPYNTYLHAGVPPGPICNPGIIAIKAALAPERTKYLYYILTYKDGRQSFATNYAEFLKLKAQYKRGLK